MVPRRVPNLPRHPHTSSRKHPLAHHPDRCSCTAPRRPRHARDGRSPSPRTNPRRNSPKPHSPKPRARTNSISSASSTRRRRPNATHHRAPTRSGSPTITPPPTPKPPPRPHPTVRRATNQGPTPLPRKPTVIDATSELQRAERALAEKLTPGK
ncbi:hypothetical protein [Pendulispora albinea]|uniref:Uncharacterized protein n=1 Tax=Pendulispora albinea TaxID=2741071 RepID=A0ABZ2LJF6_9BACT